MNVCFQRSFFFSSPRASASHRSEKSELSIGEEIEEDLSVEIDDLNTSDKVRCGRGPRSAARACVSCRGRLCRVSSYRKAAKAVT